MESFEGIPKTEVNFGNLPTEISDFEAGLADIRSDVAEKLKGEFTSAELSILDDILFNPNSITAGFLETDDSAKLDEIIKKMRGLLSATEDKKILSAEIAKEIKAL